MSCDCVLIGRLTRDCESKSTKNGRMIYTFPVASNRGFGDKQQTDFFDCMAFHPLLENQFVHLKKGCMVKVVGHFQSHESENGVRRWTMIVDSLEMLWGKPKKPDSAPEPEPAPVEEDVDLPF